MKRKLLSVFAIAALFCAANQASAQCSIDPQYANFNGYGLWPDSIPGLKVAGTLSASGYSETVSLRTLTDTSVVVSGTSVNVRVAAMRIKPGETASSVGLPTGFSFSPNYSGTNGWENTGSHTSGFSRVSGCVLLSANQAAVQAAENGGPNSNGDYPLTIKVDLKISIFEPFSSTWTSPIWMSESSAYQNQLPEVTRYTLKVRNGYTSLFEDLSKMEFNVSQNIPNPVTNNTEIHYTVPAEGTVSFNVYDMLGKEVYSSKENAKAGLNTIKLSSQILSEGIYTYSLNNGVKTISKRMVVAK